MKVIGTIIGIVAITAFFRLAGDSQIVPLDKLSWSEQMDFAACAGPSNMDDECQRLVEELLVKARQR